MSTELCEDTQPSQDAGDLYCWTGHPFVDAGVAGMAALLAEKGVAVARPEQIVPANVRDALDSLLELMTRHINLKQGKEAVPLCIPLYREVLPASSWDQVRSKDKDRLPAAQAARFSEHTNRLFEAAGAPRIGSCFITGKAAHLRVGKSAMPMLASPDERANVYPDLAPGLPVSAWVALSVLFAPIAIEKTVKPDGTGSVNLIYHSPDWSFMVEVAKCNLRRLRAMLAAGCRDQWWKRRYKRAGGTWRIALSTMLQACQRIPDALRPRVVIWCFNATNTGGTYRAQQVSPAFTVIHRTRRLQPSAYRQAAQCGNEVAGCLLQGQPISSQSIVESPPKANRDDTPRLQRTELVPGWDLQRLYAEEVLHMPVRLLDAVEQAALMLAADTKATVYCLYGSGRRLDPARLSREFGLSADTCAVFAQYHDLWTDHLRAAVVWVARGGSFGEHSPSGDAPGRIEAWLRDVADRLTAKHPPKRLAMWLSERSPSRYRSVWIRLLRDGACTWEDFLQANPIEAAVGLASRQHTRVLQDYLVAYLFATKGMGGDGRSVDEPAPPAAPDYDPALAGAETADIEFEEEESDDE